MLKILIITDNLRNQINGVVTTFKNLEEMASNDGYEIIYIDPADFVHFSAPGYSEVKLSLPIGIGRKIKNISPDHVHIATEGPIGLAARIWLDKQGWKYNTSYHTKFPEFLKKMYNVPEKFTYSYLRWFHKHSGRVLATTSTLVQELKEHGFSGDIIPWTRGVNRTLFKPLENTNREFILCVSRVSKEKNIEAFCELDHPYKVVIGDGPHLSELKKNYSKVHFLGKKTGQELVDYYQRAQVFVFPSISDTFGIVIIEAMACGTPVAAYPVTGPKDIIEPGQTGFMHENLSVAVAECLKIDRNIVEKNSKKWTWQHCWQIFKENLVNLT